MVGTSEGAGDGTRVSVGTSDKGDPVGVAAAGIKVGGLVAPIGVQPQ